MSCSITSEKILALRSSQTSCFPDVFFHTQASVQIERDGPGLTHLLSHCQWQAAALHQYGRSDSDSTASHWRNSQVFMCKERTRTSYFPEGQVGWSLGGVLYPLRLHWLQRDFGHGKREKLRHPTYVADSRMQPSLWQCTADSFSDLRDRDFTAPQVEQSAPTPNFFYHLSRTFGGGLENTCGQSSCQCHL